MLPLSVVAVGQVPRELHDPVTAFLGEALERPALVSDTVIDPAPAYAAERGQYDCRRLLPLLDGVARREGTLVLGIADVDLYSSVFTFVFGEAHLGGQAGLFSLHRLRPALYGLPDDPDRVLGRARREALHETGHLLGLVHCRGPGCVMRFSGAVEEVDLKPDRLCPACFAAVTRPDEPGQGTVPP